MVSTELRVCGNATDAVETGSAETGGMENTGPEKLKAEAVVAEDLVRLNGATVTERASGKSEDAENVGTEDEVVSKRFKS